MVEDDPPEPTGGYTASMRERMEAALARAQASVTPMFRSVTAALESAYQVDVAGSPQILRPREAGGHRNVALSRLDMAAQAGFTLRLARAKLGPSMCLLDAYYIRPETHELRMRKLDALREVLQLYGDRACHVPIRHAKQAWAEEWARLRPHRSVRWWSVTLKSRTTTVFGWRQGRGERGQKPGIAVVLADARADCEDRLVPVFLEQRVISFGGG